MESVEERLTRVEGEVDRLAASQRSFMTLTRKYDGQKIRVYLYNDRSVYGKAQFENGWVEVSDERTNRSALCNLRHVMSITKDE